jgi:hypothetical protein
MPYIVPDDRKQYDADLDAIDEGLDEYGYISGHVTYVLYKILARWWKKNPCYDTIAHIRGVLIGTLSELDRRYFWPYEIDKMNENSDVDLEHKDTNIITMACDEFECQRCNNDDEFGRFVVSDDIDNRGGA